MLDKRVLLMVRIDARTMAALLRCKQAIETIEPGRGKDFVEAVKQGPRIEPFPLGLGVSATFVLCFIWNQDWHYDMYNSLKEVEKCIQ